MAVITATLTDQTYHAQNGTNTLSGLNIGTPAPDRVVYVNIGPDGGTPTAATINGVPAQFIVDTVVFNVLWVWALVPTGTTGTVVQSGGGVTDMDLTGVWASVGDPKAFISQVHGVTGSAFPISTPAFNVGPGDALIGGMEDNDNGTPVLGFSAGIVFGGSQSNDGAGDFFALGVKNYPTAVSSQVVTATMSGGSTNLVGVTAAQITSPSPNGKILQARQSIKRASYW